MTQDTLVLPSLSPIGDKPISAVIDDRCTSADGGLLLFQDVERRLNLANRLAACLQDPRQPGKITHRLDEILRFRMLAMAIPMAMTCCGAIPFSKWRCPGLGTGVVFAALPHREHAAAPGTLSHGDARPLLFPDRHLTLDLDESFDRVHGEQELRKFNAYYDDFLPIHIFDTSGRLVVSVLREAATPSDPGPGQAGGRPSARTVPAGPDPSARRQPLCLSGSDELV